MWSMTCTVLYIQTVSQSMKVPAVLQCCGTETLKKLSQCFFFFYVNRVKGLEGRGGWWDEVSKTASKDVSALVACMILTWLAAAFSLSSRPWAACACCQSSILVVSMSKVKNSQGGLQLDVIQQIHCKLSDKNVKQAESGSADITGENQNQEMRKQFHDYSHQIATVWKTGP